MVSSPAIAALPMYDYPELNAAHDALWAALAESLDAAGIAAVPPALTRGRGHLDIWRDPRLLLAQACEYPLARGLAGCIRVVATPRYTAPGCDAGMYRSAVVVRGDDPAESLADLRGRRCAVNEPDSNSGMNLLRAAVAPLAGGLRFFESVVYSGSHRRSADMVRAGLADVAAIDCVSWAHFARLYPRTVDCLKVLCWTDPSPSLPLITAEATGEATVTALRAALARVQSAPGLAALRAQLFLDGFDFPSPGAGPATGGFDTVRRLERRAADLAYPVLE